MLKFMSEKKKWYKRIPWWGWVGIGAFVLIGGAASAINPPADTPSTTPEAAVSAPAVQPSTAPSATPSETPTAEALPPLGPRVEASLKTQWGVTNFTDGLQGNDPQMLNWYIASIDGNAGVAKVVVQVTADQTDKPEVKRLAQGIMNLTCHDVPDLDWVQVNTADSGIIQQVSRAASPLC